MPPKRYFEDEKSAKPGELSDELRAALGLHDDKLPVWIYRMRVLGYPPGWLNKADISNSSLQLFDDSSSFHESSNHEEEAAAAYNPECFVDFPGFNSPVPRGVHDHYEELRMPPMQPWQQLNYVKKTISPPKPVPYKRLKLSSAKSDTDLRQNSSTTSIIDISDDIGPDHGIEVAQSTEKSSTYHKLLDESKEISIIELSDTSFVEPQDQSNGELADDPPKDDPKDGSNGISVNESKIESKDETKDQSKDTSREPCQESTEQSLEGPSDESREKPDDKSPKSPEKLGVPETVKLVGMGCPLPADIDSKKPPLEKFAVGMGELIYFENLPTSTGVFEKMRDVIFKVRKKLSE